MLHSFPHGYGLHGLIRILTYCYVCIAAISPCYPYPGNGVLTSLSSPQSFTTDTIRMVDIGTVTIVASPKEHLPLEKLPISSTGFDSRQIRDHQVEHIKDIATLAPNLFIPNYGSSLTSAVYIRGIGSRINSPAVGLYVNDIPYIDKSAFDFQFFDIERIEVLRGPQGSLYGKNTMGGLIKVTTRNPFRDQGTSLSLSLSDGDMSSRLSLTHRVKLSDRLAFSAGGHLHAADGFHTNRTLNKQADSKLAGGGHMRAIYLPSEEVKMDFTASYEHTDEGGYPYHYMGAVDGHEEYPHLKGGISNNREHSYRRSLFNAGSHIQWRTPTLQFHAVTGYQHIDDDMHIDQDFLADDIFTLQQSQRLHTLSQEFTLKSRSLASWQHTTGLFAFHQWARIYAPVNFYGDGISMIQEAMDAGMASAPVQITITNDRIHIPGTFRSPTTGAALFHQSDLSLGNGWEASLGLRLDYEHTHINYNTYAHIQGIMNGMGYTDQPFTQKSIYRDTHNNDYLHLLPRLAISYRPEGKGHHYYASFSKGLRSGGYNFQMFSEIIQSSFRNGTVQNVNELITYKPEYSWNYELGTHLKFSDMGLEADAALFYIDTRDQQISKFTTNGLGRIMVNAGRSRSYGAEAALRYHPTPQTHLYLNYGYTHATFQKYDGGHSAEGEKTDYSGHFLPYAPQHTIHLGGSYTIPTPPSSWIRHLSLRADYGGAGRIYWTESNGAWQNFYGILNAGIGLQLPNLHIDIWAHNILNTSYDTFYFESMRRGFAQYGAPRQIGLNLSLEF